MRASGIFFCIQIGDFCIVMTIPFRCAEGTKRHEKALRRYTALKILC